MPSPPPGAGGGPHGGQAKALVPTRPREGRSRAQTNAVLPRGRGEPGHRTSKGDEKVLALTLACGQQGSGTGNEEGDHGQL